MVDKKLEQISLISDELLATPKVNLQTIMAATKLAESDDYLYDLMVDFAKQVDGEFKDMMREDIVNYTEEVIRKSERKNDRY